MAKFCHLFPLFPLQRTVKSIRCQNLIKRNIFKTQSQDFHNICLLTLPNSFAFFTLLFRSGLLSFRVLQLFVFLSSFCCQPFGLFTDLQHLYQGVGRSNKKRNLILVLPPLTTNETIWVRYQFWVNYGFDLLYHLLFISTTLREQIEFLNVTHLFNNTSTQSIGLQRS